MQTPSHHALTRYRIVVRGPIPPRLLELLEETTVGEAGSSSILTCDLVDQTKLQAMLAWLHEAGVEVVSLDPLGDP